MNMNIIILYIIYFCTREHEVHLSAVSRPIGFPLPRVVVKSVVNHCRSKHVLYTQVHDIK